MLPLAPVQFHEKILTYFKANGLDPSTTASASFREKYALIDCLADVIWAHAKNAGVHPEDIVELLGPYAALVVNKGDITGIQTADYKCSMHDLLRLQPMAKANLIPRQLRKTNPIFGVYLNANRQWIQSSLQYAFARIHHKGA